MLKIKFGSLLKVSSLAFVFSTPVVSMAARKLPSPVTSISEDAYLFSINDFKHRQETLKSAFSNENSLLGKIFNKEVQRAIQKLDYVPGDQKDKYFKVKTNRDGFSIVTPNANGDYIGTIITVDQGKQVSKKTFNTNSLENTSSVTGPNNENYIQRLENTYIDNSTQREYEVAVSKEPIKKYDVGFINEQDFFGRPYRVEKSGNNYFYTKYEKQTRTIDNKRYFTLRGNVDDNPRKLYVEFHSVNDHRNTHNRAVSSVNFELPKSVDGIIIGAKVLYTSDEKAQLAVKVLGSNNEVNNYFFKLTAESSGEYKGATDVLKIDKRNPTVQKDLNGKKFLDYYLIKEEILSPSIKREKPSDNGVHLDMGSIGIGNQ